MPDLLDRLCAMCHEFPQMKASPGHFCSTCYWALRKKALDDRFQGIMADRGRRDPEWRIPAQNWRADAGYGGQS